MTTQQADKDRQAAEEWTGDIDPLGVADTDILDFIKGAFLAGISYARRPIKELFEGDGIYYIPQERAMAPGIAGEWPDVIPHPTNRHGRLVKRRLPTVEGE